MSLRLLLAVLFCGLAAGCAPHRSAPPTDNGTSVQLSPCLISGTRPPPGIVVGFGQGSSLAEARQRAYAHISEQLSVQVQSQSQANTQKQNAELQASFQQSVSSYSEARLSDLELGCLDQHTTPGQVYLTYRYDQRALATRITEKLVDALGYVPAQIHWQGPLALTNSLLLTRINGALARQGGSGAPRLAVGLAWRSDEKNWLLTLDDLPVTLSPAQLQVAVDWSSLSRGGVELAALSLQGGLQARQVSAGTEYRLALRHPTGGYAQLIGIYENGELHLLRNDLQLSSDQVFIVPETGGVFEAGLLEGNRTTDTFLVLVTDKPLRATDLPSLNRRSDEGQLQHLLTELETMRGDVAVVQLSVQ